MKQFQFVQNRIISFLMIVLLIFSTALFPAFAADEETTAVRELPSVVDVPEEDEVAQEQAEDIATESTKKELEAQEKAKKEYEKKESAYKKANSSVKKINGEIESLEAEIIDTIADIEKLDLAAKAQQQAIDDMYNAFKGRLKAIYMSGAYTNVQALLTTESFADYLTRAEMIRAVSRQDAAAIKKMLKAYDKLKKQLEKIQNERIKLEVKEADLQTSKADLELKKAEAAKAYNDSIEELKKVDEANKAEKVRIAAEQKELKEIVALCKKEAKISKEIAKELKDGSYKDVESEIVSNGGTLCFPVPSCKEVSCGFYGYTNHNGMDFANMKINGQKVVATKDGKIMSVKLLDYSYGHHVWINHGDNIATLYAHMSRIVVKEGQVVKQGQVIGYVGSTGNSTGPHLHFGLLVDGKFVNPINFF